MVLISEGSSTRYSIDNFCAKNGIILKPKIELGRFSLTAEFTKMYQ